MRPETSSSLMAELQQRRRAFPIEPVRRNDKQPKTYPQGRVCASCPTHLSIYNGSKRCWQCRSIKRPRRLETLEALMQETGIG